jgi:GTP-binding protein
MSAEMPRVVIVGRPNVGKSTLFNTLVRRAAALTSPVAGTTRDWIEAELTVDGRTLQLVDSCGWGSGGSLGELMDASLERALAGADAVVFVVAANEAAGQDDASLAAVIRQRQLPVMVVCNKCDRPDVDAAAWEFSRLGLGQPLPVSAVIPRNMAELRTRVAVLASVPAHPLEAPSARGIFLGQPNVGKSSLFNAMLEAERSLVHDVPGTTRDPVHATLKAGATRWDLVDTAGVSRRIRDQDAMHRDAQRLSLKSLEDADVALLVLDLTVPFARQDLRLADRAAELGAGMAVALNKCDLLPREDVERLRTEGTEFLLKRFAQLGRFPVLLTSATTREGVPALLAAMEELLRLRRVRIPSDALAAAAFGWPSTGTPWRVRQTEVAPLRFSVRVPFGIRLNDRFVVNRLRDSFGLHGVPIIIERQRRKDH